MRHLVGPWLSGTLFLVGLLLDDAGGLVAAEGVKEGVTEDAALGLLLLGDADGRDRGKAGGLLEGLDDGMNEGNAEGTALGAAPWRHGWCGTGRGRGMRKGQAGNVAAMRSLRGYKPC